MYQQVQRRPIKMRSAAWSQALASWLVQRGFSPNQISVASAGVAVLGAIFFIVSSITSRHVSGLAFLAAAFCIQARLLFNMLDGLMAVENGKCTKQGELFNEFPDRIADVVLIVAASYACRAGQVALTLGWTAAILAVGTAYIRAFGARYLKVQDFSGPMAKPQRMFLLTIGSFGGAIEMMLNGSAHLILAVLVVVCFGTALTCINRTKHLYCAMEKI